jgi:hypothetical protein
MYSALDAWICVTEMASPRPAASIHNPTRANSAANFPILEFCEAETQKTASHKPQIPMIEATYNLPDVRTSKVGNDLANPTITEFKLNEKGSTTRILALE